MELLLSLHRTNAYVAIAWMLVCAVTGLVRHHRECSTVGRLYGAGLAAGALLIGLQSLLGLALFVAGLRPADPLHVLLYGTLAPVLLPFAYVYYLRRSRSQGNLVFGVATLFLAAFLLRATFTA
ncbi:MAG: hypothetical protein HYY05_06635 [Chloroflexi bacterium]|nr:hypothetical protein [Chloroflexota bacterium]